MNKLFCDAMVYVPGVSLLLEAKSPQVSLRVTGAALLEIAPTVETFLSHPLNRRSRKLLTIRISGDVGNSKVNPDCSVNWHKRRGSKVDAYIKKPDALTLTQEGIPYPTAIHSSDVIWGDSEFNILSPRYRVESGVCVLYSVRYGVVGDEWAK